MKREKVISEGREEKNDLRIKKRLRGSDNAFLICEGEGKKFE